MKKRGSVWISAVLYFGLGIVVISILLAAGMPVINKLRDKNVVIQSKEVMHTLDQNIREVIREGPGSQRIVTVNIKKGAFIIDESPDRERIVWVYNNSKILISDLDTEVFEGKLTILTTKGSTGYNIEIYTEYGTIADLTRPSDRQYTLVGINDLVIRNNGLEGGKIVVSISEANR